MASNSSGHKTKTSCRAHRGPVMVYTRVRNARLSEPGIWMVSRAREEGLNGKVTG